jgi:two-component system, sensor histidine kinase RegB
MSRHFGSLPLDLHGRLRLDTLVRLRWLAVIGQSAGVLGVHVILGFPLPLSWCFLAIATSAALNFALRVRFPISYRLGEKAATALLGYDILQLAVLLYLTGGLQNPFAILFLAPVMISATALPPRRTLLLGALVMACASVLVFFYMPLPWHARDTLSLPFLYVIGIWGAIMLSLAFIATYAWRVAEEGRALAAALTATELVLAREQHLSQLDGLAAAAAHELGTPLSTIALVVKDLAIISPRDGPIAEDMVLLQEQVVRCRDILSKLTSLEDGHTGPLGTLTLSHLIEEVAGPQRPFGVPLRRDINGKGKEPDCRRNPGLIYGLANLVDNAVDFAASEVSIRAIWDAEHVKIIVSDDGPGFASDILMRLGEPYVTTRAQLRREGGDVAPGLGLGLFIAKTLLERTGADVSFANSGAPKTGAIVRIEWPRADFEDKGGLGLAET